MYEIYRNIKKLREQRGWTQTYLAEKVGYCDKTVISKLENGKVKLDVPHIQKIAEVFGVTPGELMGDIEETVAVELTDTERAVIFAYRNAPRLIQDAVHGVLGIEKREQKSLNSRKEA